MSDLNIVQNDSFLSQIRNAIILLVVGLAVLEFGGKLKTVAILILILDILLFIVALIQYWQPNYLPNLNLMAYLIIALIGIIFWIIWQALKNK